MLSIYFIYKLMKQVYRFWTKKVRDFLVTNGVNRFSILHWKNWAQIVSVAVIENKLNDTRKVYLLILNLFIVSDEFLKFLSKATSKNDH